MKADDIPVSDEFIDDGFNPSFSGETMPRQGEPKIVLLTKDYVRKMLSYNVFKHQRPITGYARQRRMEELARKIVDGRFHGNDFALVYLDFDYEYLDANGNKCVTRVLLMNGQTTCQAFLSVADSIGDRKIFVTEKVFFAKNEEQLGTLFAQFDAPGGNRTTADVARTYTDVFPGLKQELIRLGLAAIEPANNYLENGQIKSVLSRHDKTTDERVALMKARFQPSLRFANQLLYGEGYNNTPKMRIQGVVAAILATYVLKPGAAERFWHLVRDGAHCEINSPELTLRNYLCEISISAGGSSRSGGKAVGQAEVFEICLLAWSKHIKGEKCQRLILRRKNKSPIK